MSFYSHFLDGTETGGHLLKVLAVCFKTKAINIVIPARLGVRHALLMLDTWHVKLGRDATSFFKKNYEQRGFSSKRDNVVTTVSTKQSTSRSCRLQFTSSFSEDSAVFWTVSLLLYHPQTNHIQLN